jgi:hypothetical protein
VQGTSIYFVFSGHGLNTQPYLNLETDKLKTDPLVIVSHLALSFLRQVLSSPLVKEPNFFFQRRQLVICGIFLSLFNPPRNQSMFAVLHSDINSFKSGLLHLTGQPDYIFKLKKNMLKVLTSN